MIKKIFNSKAKNFTVAAFFIAVFTILSGLLGLLRDRLLAGTFGAGEVLDIYFTAFRLPDLVYAILIGGGFTAVFLPLFSQKFEKDKKEAFKFANNLLNSSLIFLLVICFILVIFAPQLLKMMAPGFTSEARVKTVILTRIMLLSPILFAGSAIFSGMLQYFDRFLVFSLTPVMYNLGVVLGIVFFVPFLGIYGLGLGVLVGVLMHWLIQVPTAKDIGYRYLRFLNLKELNPRKILRLMLPASLGAGFGQLNLIVITALCSTLISGSITIFNFARNLQGLPASVIGIPFSISLFPLLSKAWVSKKREEFFQNFSLACRQILFLIVPISVLAFILRAQVVRIVLGAGQWGWQETRLTAASLGVFSFSIFGLALIPFFQKSFYSIQDTKTPTLFQLVSVSLNIGLSVIFLTLLRTPNLFYNFFSQSLKLAGIDSIQVIAFPLAFTFSLIIQSILLFWVFIKKVGFNRTNEVLSSGFKILINSLFMGIIVWWFLRPLSRIFALTTFLNVFSQAFFATLVGILTYVVGALFLDLPELKTLKNSFLRKPEN